MPTKPSMTNGENNQASGGMRASSAGQPADQDPRLKAAMMPLLITGQSEWIDHFDDGTVVGRAVVRGCRRLPSVVVLRGCRLMGRAFSAGRVAPGRMVSDKLAERHS
jgi:hypothetical protein